MAQIPNDSKPTSNDSTWVWYSTVYSRCAGQISVLACVETLFAVSLYWWIAIRFNTHWHLVSSAIIAPLLLLRSPSSMETGVRLFLKDWLVFEDYERWSRDRKNYWKASLVLIAVFLSYFFTCWLSYRWLPGLESWPLFSVSASVGALSLITVFAVVFSFAFAVAGVGLHKGVGAFTIAITGTIVLASAVAIAVIAAAVVACVTVGRIAGLTAGVFAFEGVIAVAVVGAVLLVNDDAGSAGVLIVGAVAGAGLATRSFFFRIVATLRFLIIGAERLPKNWHENNFLTDSFYPAELMPGIRDSVPEFSMDGLSNAWRENRDERKRLLYVVVGTFLFLPAFFYRLNIKATAWFWWPLAYLLNPAPAATEEGQQKQAICWPWTNPFKRLVIVGSVILSIISLTILNVDLPALANIKHGSALPLAVKVLLAMDWAKIEPWHWAQWLIAFAGAGMLILAGDARSHDVTGDWVNYCPSWPRNIFLMTCLLRLRTLATVALLLMAFGALLLQDRTWMSYVPVPDNWIVALEQFYQ